MKKLTTLVFVLTLLLSLVIAGSGAIAQATGSSGTSKTTAVDPALKAEFDAKAAAIDNMSGPQADQAYHALINDSKYTAIIQSNPSMYSGSSLQNYDYSNAKVSDATKEKLAGITNLLEEDANGNKVHADLIDELIANGDYNAIRDAERAQNDMRAHGTTQEEAEKFVEEDRARKEQELAEARANAKCIKNGQTSFARYLLSYVGSGGGNFCWFCPMFEGLFDAMNNLATAISVKMADVFLMIMGVGLLFSIAFKVAKMVTSMQGADLMQFLTDMFKHLGRAIIATALLVSSLSIFTYLVSPVLTMSMSMSSIIMDEGGGRGAVIKATQKTGISAGTICDDLADQMKTTPNVESQTKAFTPDVKASFICALRTMSAGLIFGVLLGVIIYSLAYSNMILGFLPNIQYAILGIIIVIGHLAILITFPFKLIDSMIRMAFVTALMPLWIILWVFPATVGYTKKAWDLFLSSCLIFVCLSVVITLVMTIMQYAIPNREEIIGLLVCGFDVQAADKIPIGGKELLVTAALTFLGWKMLGTATTLASSFVGAIPDLGIGQSINETTVKGARLAGKGARVGGRALANSKVGQWAARKTNMSNSKAAKLGAWGAAGIATAGAAPVLYGAAKGGYAGIKAAANAVRKRFGGGGASGAGGAPSTPPPPPTGGGTQGGAPNTKAPNMPSQSPTGTPQGGTPNTPSTGGAPSMPTPSAPGGTSGQSSSASGAQGATATGSYGTSGAAPARGAGNVNRQSFASPEPTSTGGTGTTETMSFGPAGQTDAGTTATTMGSGSVNDGSNLPFGEPKATSSSGTEYYGNGETRIAMGPKGSVHSEYTQDSRGSAEAGAAAGAATGVATGAAAGAVAGSMAGGAGGGNGTVDPIARDMAQSASAQARTAAAQAQAAKDAADKNVSAVKTATEAAKTAQSKAEQATTQAANAQTAASQAMSEASKKDKDDDKKNKPE